ncbi:hypothetical protein [Nocardioides humi]|uniref:hypothetical protein n=1 Tax=Nocardioides humi TaxID=449461 RepID=UPI0015E83427|nr:hypothetical protein [Nocardioides humi]
MTLGPAAVTSSSQAGKPAARPVSVEMVPLRHVIDTVRLSGSVAVTFSVKVLVSSSSNVVPTGTTPREELVTRAWLAAELPFQLWTRQVTR